MMQMFKEGGPPMWFVVAFGLATLVNAGIFVRRLDESRVALVRALTWATLLTMAAGFTAGVAMSVRGITRLPAAEHAHWAYFVALGTQESLANIVVGSILLALAWLTCAVGIRRLAAR